jgi:ABC-type nitrate/sulfonate/bicarbonate transport system substrate-binding protein
MRKINVGVSVAPPNVVHTSPYIAKALGFFAKRCIDASIVQFEGGQSQTSMVAAAQGSALVSVSDVSIGRGLKVQQIWALAPRMPQAYMVPGEIKTAADLKGKRLSATGGGVGGFNWRMGREVLKSAGLTENDAQFIPSPTAGRLPGLIAGQIDGVALHPEDVFLARKQKDMDCQGPCAAT